MLHVFIDESGNVPSTGELFVLCAVVTEDVKLMARMYEKWIVNHFREKGRGFRGEVKYSDGRISPAMREKTIAFLLGMPVKVYAVTSKSGFFEYLEYVTTLLTLVLGKNTPESMTLLLDNRSIKGMKTHQVEEYIEDFLQKDFSNMHVYVRMVDSEVMRGVQVADWFAGAIRASECGIGNYGELFTQNIILYKITPKNRGYREK